MKLQQMFVVPLWAGEFDLHAECKQKYIDSLTQYFDNHSIVTDKADCNTAYTKSTLHIDSTYFEIIEQIMENCPNILKELNIDPTCTVGIDRMQASVSSKGGIIPENFETSALLKGFYFLQTPPESGEMNIRLDVADRSYFDLVQAKERNTINTNCLDFPIPEGSILIMPAHLTTNITANLSSEQRIIITFNLKMFVQ